MSAAVWHEKAHGHDDDPKIEAVPWLVDGLWTRGQMFGAMLGFEKCGKSRLISHLLAHMLAQPKGGPVMWHADGNGPALWHSGIKRVLYLHEEPREKIQNRINWYARQSGFTPSKDWPITYLFGTGSKFDQPYRRELFERQFVSSGDYDLIFMDTLRRVQEGDEDSNTRQAPMFNDMQAWTYRYKLGLMLVHHSPKWGEATDTERIASWARGASDLASVLDVANMMKGVMPTPDGFLRTVKVDGRVSVPDVLELFDRGDYNPKEPGAPYGFVVKSGGLSRRQAQV